MEPFMDDDTVIVIGDLSVESGSSLVLVHGSFEILKDQRSLAQVRKLRAVLENIEETLERISELPELARIAPISGVSTVKNPFD